jgi:hypothetical protein
VVYERVEVASGPLAIDAGFVLVERPPSGTVVAPVATLEELGALEAAYQAGLGRFADAAARGEAIVLKVYDRDRFYVVVLLVRDGAIRWAMSEDDRWPEPVCIEPIVGSTSNVDYCGVSASAAWEWAEAYAKAKGLIPPPMGAWETAAGLRP